MPRLRRKSAAASARKKKETMRERRATARTDKTDSSMTDTATDCSEHDDTRTEHQIESLLDCLLENQIESLLDCLLENQIELPEVKCQIENAESENAESENAESENAESENAESQNAESQNAGFEGGQSETVGSPIAEVLVTEFQAGCGPVPDPTEAECSGDLKVSSRVFKDTESVQQTKSVADQTFLDIPEVVEESSSLHLVFGTRHQGAVTFSEETRGRQCTCTSLYTLACSAEAIHLDTAFVDESVCEGDKLYAATIQTLKRQKCFNDYYLTFEELPQYLLTTHSMYTVIKHEVFIGTVDQMSVVGVSNLDAGIRQAFRVSDKCLLLIGNACSALFQKDGKIWYFDSNSHDVNGMTHPDGKPLLAACDSVDMLLLFLYSYLESMHTLPTTAFEIQPVTFQCSKRVQVAHADSTGLLQGYFDSQLYEEVNKQLRERVIQSNTSRSAYMKLYMQKRRRTPFREMEKAKELKQKQGYRKDTNTKQQLAANDLRSKQKARKDAEKHKNLAAIDFKHKQQARKDPKKRQALAANDLKHKQQARKDPKKRRALATNDLRCKQQAHKDPVKHQKLLADNLKYQQQARKNSEKRQNLAANDLRCKQRARKDPEKRQNLAANDLRCKQQARKDPEKRQNLAANDLRCKQHARKDPEKRQNLAANDLRCKQQARKDPEKRQNLAANDLRCKQQARNDPEKRQNQNRNDLKSKQKQRNNQDFRDKERMKKDAKRKIEHHRFEENLRNQELRSNKRSHSDVFEREQTNRKKRRYGNVLEECIEKFHKAVATGPVYVCTCCHQTCFKHSVHNVESNMKCIDNSVRERLLTHFLSVDNAEWICNTCLNSIRAGKIPALAVANKNTFPEKPPELELHQLEERLISLRIPFMQIRELPRGGQLSIRGNVVNVPVDIQPVITMLPRHIDENVTVPVKLKKKLSYQKCDFTENVRPMCVITAVHWLMNHSDLYKNSGIQIDEDWLNRINQECTDTVQEFLGQQQANSSNSSTDATENNGYESDGFSEVDERDKVVGNSDTLIDSYEPTAATDTVYTFAPGEGATPISLYQDTNAEYLSFPTLFCGQTHAENTEREVPVHYSNLCKWELRHVDRRVANSVPNIFFKMKKLQLKQVTDKVHLALRRCKSHGPRMTVADVLNPSQVDKLVHLDEGYYIFRTLRNSPPYLEARKKDIFAMIRQLGLPTWFTSLSSADTRWPDLLKMLAKLNGGKTLSDEDVESMTWAEKANLVQKDPVTCTRYFDHRVQEFINVILKSPHHPVGKVLDYFYRVEFQQRGSPHIHMLIWIKDAPVYKSSSEMELQRFIDQYVSCSHDVASELKPLVDLQTHKHSRSCRKKTRAICRFGFPLPPMNATVVLEPLENKEEKTKYKKIYTDVQKKLDGLKDSNITLSVFLEDLSVSEDDYIKAVRSSIDSPKVFLKRKVSEIRTNAYMKSILSAWKANQDLQFIVDPYACAVYVVSYISKAMRGMSILMSEACKEARQGNMDLRRQVRHIGNKFLNSVEISAQEACYLVLQLPLTRSSRDVVFINTSKPEERTFLLKGKSALEKLAEDSTEIEADNVIKRYSKRPKQLEHWCLADFVSQLEIKYPQNDDAEEIEHEVNEDDIEEDLPHIAAGNEIKITLKSGIVIRSRQKPKVIRYVRFSIKTDAENHYRERLLLFHPWRRESEDLKGSFQSYEQHYQHRKQFIEAKARQYEHNIEEIDGALQRATDELSFDHIAPGNEQTEADDAEAGSSNSKEFIYFDPDRPDIHRVYDIGQDVGASVALVDIQVQTKTMPDEQYHTLIRSLNLKQREFFTHVVQSVKTASEPVHAFLTGGAGVGKSVVVKALFETLQRHLSSGAGDNPDNCRVLLCAPTGKAAFNINGLTLHTALRIPASQGFNCKPLDSDTLNTLRVKYRSLTVVVIDEVSMVGHRMFKLVNERLKQIKGSSVDFGGVHMIVIGDLFQIEPVMDGWIFQNLSQDFGPLATNLWRDLFTMHELEEIMRQKDDVPFSHLLNRLREGNHTSDDIQMLKQQLTNNHPNYPNTAVHLFPLNKSVRDFNQHVYQDASTAKVSVPALDTVLGDDSQSVKARILTAINDNPAHTAGLSNVVELALELKYDITANLDVDDGLTNGSTCTIKCIEAKQQATSRPSVVWVLFENSSVGISRRNKYKYLYSPTIDSSWTPIFDVKRTFLFRHKSVIRIQFPLRQSTAKTIHKSQGDTLNEVVVDMSGSRIFPHAHYVALSRVKNLAGLHILELNEDKISLASCVKKEMARLRQEARLALCYTPLYTVKNDLGLNCVIHNVRSLKCHFRDIREEPNIRAASVIGLVETWLVDSDESALFTMQGYQMIRSDGLTTGRSRPHRGIVIYIADWITLLHKKVFRRAHIEYMLVMLELQNSLKIQVVTMYRSPTCEQNEFREVVSENLCQDLSFEVPLVLQGDINSDILKGKSSYQEILETVLRCTQVVKKSTHVSGSLLDHIYTNTQIVATDVIDCIWSDHSIAYVAVL